MGDADFTHPSFYLADDQQLDKSFALPRRATLKIEVLNERDKGVPRAKVTLRSIDKETSRWAHSNLQGIAYLYFMKRGEYQLQIKAAGYSLWEETLTIPSEQGVQSETRTLQVASSAGR
jgi:hypothetical protein